MNRPFLLMIGPATDRMLDRLTEVFEIRHMDTGHETVPPMESSLVECIYVNGLDVPASLINALPRLRIISNCGVGYDMIDVEAAVRRGIVVTHTRDVLNDDVANTAILLMLTTSRNFVADNAHIRSGRWPIEGDVPLSGAVRGKTVGILGLGRIGLTLAEKLAVFGVEIVYHNRNRRDVAYRYFDDLVEMAQECDILICVAPGSESTNGIVNRSVMDALGPDGTFINIGRGSIVDEPELISALREGRLGKAGIDVFAKEPDVPPELLALENATLLPHVASATVETRDAMGDLAVENLIRFHTTGKALTPVPECSAIPVTRTC